MKVKLDSFLPSFRKTEKPQIIPSDQPVDSGIQSEQLKLHEIIKKGLNDNETIFKKALAETTSEELGRQDKTGSTALHLAVQWQETKTVDLLLEKMNPKQITTVDFFGGTAMHWACFYANSEIFKILLNKMGPESLFTQNNIKKTSIEIIFLGAVSYDHRFKKISLDRLHEIIKRCSNEQLSHIGILVPDSIKKNKELLADKDWKKLIDEFERFAPIN